MADPMTREQLAAYVQLAENIREKFGDNWQIVDDEDADEVSVRTEDSTPVFFTELFATSQTSGDDPLEVAGFLAAAIDYVPRMAAMIRQAEAELAGAYQGAEELRGMYRDLKDRATEIERQRDQLRTEQATVFAVLREALGTEPATLGQATKQAIKVLTDVRAERELLREFVAAAPCDPHPGNGYCQSHGEKAPCPHAEAKALLGLDGTEAGT